MFLLIFVSALGTFGDVPTSDRVRATVESSLVFMQDDADNWMQTLKCATCHHMPMLVWTANLARARGFRLDEDVYRASRKLAVEDPRAGKLTAKEGEPTTPDSFAFSASYAAIASNAVAASELSEAARQARKELRGYLLATQFPDGSWTKEAPGGRPPILEGPEIATSMTLLALTGWDDAEVVAARQRGRAWLESKPAKSAQARVLRLLLDVREKADAASIAGQVEALLASQNADGGWSQTAKLPSDAYATGMALFVLQEAGVEPSRPQLTRAVDFLIKTQTDDGSWPMISRPNNQGGPGARDLRPITYAGTAWATLALLRTLPTK